MIEKDRTSALKLAQDDKIMLEYLKEVKDVEQNGNFIELYSDEEKWKRDGFISGKIEGREEGRAEGREEGRAEGEQKQQLEIANNLICDGFSLEAVAKNTKLSLEKVKDLYDKLKKDKKILE